jgi:outer membrane receptor protein involved in Fe transport
MWREISRLPTIESSGIGKPSGLGWLLSLTSLSVWFFILAAAPGFAQDNEPDPFAGIEEMVVLGDPSASLLTAQSTSSVAFDNASLEAYGVEDLGDIAAFVPNLDIRSQNATNASFFIRGVGLQDFGANASSAVPIIQDGIIRNPSATQLVGLYDVAGLTVLRGPQATGNFRNASAGAIIVQTAKPQSEFSGYAKVTLSQIVSNDAVDATRYDFESAVTSGVYEDIVSIRLSARYAHENPFVENRCANRVPFEARVPAAYGNDPAAQLCEQIIGTDGLGRPVGINGENVMGGVGGQGDISEVVPFLDKRLGEVDDYGFRAQVRIQPPDTSLDLIFRAEISNLNRDSTVGSHMGSGGGRLGASDLGGYRETEVIRRNQQLLASGLSVKEANAVLNHELFRAGFDSRPYSGSFDSPGRTQLETLTLSTTATMQFDAFDAEFNAGYIDYRKSDVRDTDLSPNRLFPSDGDDQAWEVYVDFDVGGESIADVPVTWRVGGYTLLENVEARQLQVNPAFFDRENKFDQEIYSFGAFVDLEYEFLEAFTLAAGARYNWEQKHFEVQDTKTLQFVGNDLSFLEGSENQLTWDDFTGFAEIRYDFTEEIGAYMKYTRGFKAGHFNPSRPTEAEVPNSGFADPEQIDSLEWGLDFAGWGGRISGNGALFYYNYRNYQVFRLSNTFRGVFREIQNAKKARNLGIELEFTIRPLEGYVPEAIEGLSINLRGGWLDTEFLEFTNVEQRNIIGNSLAVTIDNTGNPLISAAELQVTLTAIWPVYIAQLGTITPHYDFSWTDDTPFDPNRGRGQIDIFGNSDFPPYQIGNRAYAIHNVRLTYEPPGEGQVRISGWCRNVTDKRFDNFAVDLSTFAQVQLHYPADPRICGADVRFSW